MSYDNPRIKLNDSIQEILINMAGGNPGALTVLINMFKEGGKIDPDDFLGGLGSILSLDSHDIYEHHIWMLYKDVCGQDLTRMFAMLRAVQLGYLAEARLVSAVKDGQTFSAEEIEGYEKKVRERLPAFGKV